MNRALIRYLIIWLLIAFVLSGFFYWLLTERVQLLAVKDGSLVISDFAYHVLLVRAFWWEGLQTVYRLNTQSDVLQAAVGSSIDAAMPVGVTPLALILWAPFAFAARHSLPLAQSLWMALSFCLFAAAILPLHGWPGLKSRRRYWIALILLSICSGCFVEGLLLGQTALAASAALLFLLCALEDSPLVKTWRQTVQVILLLVVLAFKPTYLALGWASLLFYRRYRELAFSAILTGLLLLGLSCKLGWSWPADYLQQLSVYTSGSIPAYYTQSIAPETMNNLLHLARARFGDAAAARWSLAILLCLSCFTIFLGSIRRQTSRPLCFSLTMIALYLLFSPYLGAYEDILLIVLTAFSCRRTAATSPQRSAVAALILVTAVLLNAKMLSSVLGPLMLWLLKASFVAGAVVAARGALPQR